MPVPSNKLVQDILSNPDAAKLMTELQAAPAEERLRFVISMIAACGIRSCDDLDATPRWRVLRRLRMRGVIVGLSVASEIADMMVKHQEK